MSVKDSESNGMLPQVSIVLVVLVSTATQVASAMGIAIFPVIAPQLALMLGVDASYVGYQISMVFGAAMLASCVVGPVVLRWGACRAMQWSMWLAATGLLAALSGQLWLMPIAAMGIGASNALAAGGASHLLFRFSQARNRNLIYSIKQTGVPLGWATAALFAPILTVQYGWRMPMLIVFCYAIFGGALLGRWCTIWDDDRNPQAAQKTNLLSGIVLLWHYPILRYLGIASLFFSFAQSCLGTFTVNLLVQEADYSLVAAGLMLSVIQISGVSGRVIWGLIADRLGSAMGLLVVGSVLMAVGCLVSFSLSGHWPQPLLVIFYMLFGMVAYGWNGILHAQIARYSPTGMVSVATGGMMAWVFGGILIGPALFAFSYRWLGRYTWTYGLLTIIALTGALFAGMAFYQERKLHQVAVS